MRTRLTEQRRYYDGFDHLERYYTPRATRQFLPEEETFLDEFARRYATPDRPTMFGVWREMSRAMLEVNEQRMAQGFPPLRAPSFATFRRRVAKLPAHVVQFGRGGAQGR